MFDWDPKDEKVIVKLPFEIYWGTTGPLVVIFIISILVMRWRKREERKAAKRNEKTSYSDGAAKEEVASEGNGTGETGSDTGTNESTQWGCMSRSSYRARSSSDEDMV
jgi:hypothetical protein